MSNTTRAGTEAVAGDAADYAVQIGPSLPQGGPPVQGYVSSPTAKFFVSLGQGDPSATYASVRLPSGWQPIPNNEPVSVTVSGASGVLWQYNVPQGVDFKFLLGPG